MRNFTTLCVSIGPVNLEKFNAFRAAHGNLPMGKAIGLLCDLAAESGLARGFRAEAMVERPPSFVPLAPSKPSGPRAGERVVELSAEDWG